MNYLRQLNLFGKIADIPYDLIGETDPTSATEARSGMGYFNKLSRAFFICVDDTPGAYIWIKVAAGGSSGEDAGSGEPGVGITSITTVSTSDESNGVNVYAINLTDGSSYNIEVRNGSAGKDYVLTEADKAEIAGMVDVPTISDVEVVQVGSDNPENDTYAIRITCDDGSEYTAELPALITDPSRVVILHDGTPTDSTEGAKHQLLVDTATLNIYICLGSSGIGAMTYYTWQQIQGAVTSVNGKTGAVQLSASDVGALPNTTKIPSKTSDLQNDSGFVGNTVSNLTNYYLKSETYTRDEVTALIAAVKTYTVSVVSELPSTGAEKVIYLVVKADGSDKDAHNEYLWVNGKFEFIGTTAVDLTGYAKEDWVSGQLTNCLKTTDLQSAIDTALAQAKECGEFDGEPGVSPTVSVADITGGHRVTITDKEGTKTVDVMDGSNGDPGDPGRGITSVQRTSGTGAAGTTDIYTITYSDSTTSTFTVYNGANGDDYTLTEADKTEIAQQAAALVDVDGVVKSTEQTFTDDEKAQVRTNIEAAATTDLLNYYTKSQTYTQEEIRTLVSAIPKFTISVVNVLPTTDISTTTVYLVKSGSDTDLYTEYIFIVDGNAPENGDGAYDETSGTWEILGSQRVDLTGYATEEWVNLRLAEFVTADKIVDLLGYTPAKESEIPTKVSQLENDSGYANQTEVNQLSNAIADKIEKNQGAENTGKSLVVGADGNVIPALPDVGIEQCKFIEYKKGANLFNKADITMDAFLTNSGALVTGQAKCAVSGFIEIKPDTTYTRSKSNLSLLFYDETQKVISTVDPATTTFTTPATAKYIRSNFNYTVTSADVYMIVEGDTLPSGYEPYGSLLKIGDSYVATTDAGTAGSMDSLFGKWGAIGDSLTNQEKWQSTVISMLNIPEWHKNAITGSCIANYGDNTVTAFVDRYTDTPADCDCITIMGGTNDCTLKAGANIGEIGTINTTTFIGAYQTIIEGLLSRTPSVRIILITPPRCYTAEGVLNANLIKYVDAVKQIAEYYGLPCLDLYHTMGVNDVTVNQYLADYVHFTDAGGVVVGRLIGNFIKNNY